jgi:Peptidase propeptide and YPEB domain
MPMLSEDAATHIALAYAHEAAGSAAQAYRVRRVDGGRDYYLVVMGEKGRSQAEVSVDAETGEVLGATPRQTGGSTIAIDAATAASRAGFGAGADVSLVWRPSRASMSPFYPVWEIKDGSRTAFVDQTGAVWRDLPASGRGGSKSGRE